MRLQGMMVRHDGRINIDRLRGLGYREVVKCAGEDRVAMSYAAQPHGQRDWLRSTARSSVAGKNVVEAED